MPFTLIDPFAERWFIRILTVSLILLVLPVSLQTPHRKSFQRPHKMRAQLGRDPARPNGRFTTTKVREELTTVKRNYKTLKTLQEKTIFQKHLQRFFTVENLTETFSKLLKTLKTNFKIFKNRCSSAMFLMSENVTQTLRRLLKTVQTF